MSIGTSCLSFYCSFTQPKRVPVAYTSFGRNCFYSKPLLLRRFTKEHLHNLSAKRSGDWLHEHYHNNEPHHSGSYGHLDRHHDHHRHHCDDSDLMNQSHCHQRDGRSINKLQASVYAFSRATGWYQLANYLRSHLLLCCLSAGLFLIATVCPYLTPMAVSKPLQLILIAIALPLVGISACFDALVDLAGGKVNIHVLMAISAIFSILLGNSLEGGLLLAMFNLAHIAEEYYMSLAMVHVRELKESYPDFAVVVDAKSDNFLISNMSPRKVPVNDLEVGSFILIRAGELVPVDCEVVQGQSLITVEHLTGEMCPVEKKPRDRIPGGARNMDGVLVAKVVKTWQESTLNIILQLTQKARQMKPKLQRWLDQFGDLYSALVILLSIVIALAGPFFFGWPFLSTPVCRGSIHRALGMMVAASPCALAVAPLVYFTAMSACARRGILLKGNHVLDAMASCTVIAFDKTGTLTTGLLRVKAVEPIVGHGLPSCCIPTCEEEALAIAAAMEQGTTHPIARAVASYALGRNLTPFSVKNFDSIPGRGVSATLSCPESGVGGEASLGSVDYIASLCERREDVVNAVKTSSHGTDSVCAALHMNRKITLLHLEDQPRPRIFNLVSALRNRLKFRTVMLTGDHHSSAWSVANAAGIDEVYCGLNPQDKLDHVNSFSSIGGLVMVGDGVNDAPALAAATVGIALAEHASSSAVSAADVLLLRDEIQGVLFCIDKSRKAASIVRQNVALALLSVAVTALPCIFGILPLWLAVVLHEGGTLLVCLNSARAF